MSDDHRLLVFDEPTLDGKDANIAAWQGYVGSFLEYVIYPHKIMERDGTVLVVGHTTGSHLTLCDEGESRSRVIWRAIVHDGRLVLWQILEDPPDQRNTLGVTAEPLYMRLTRGGPVHGPPP